MKKRIALVFLVILCALSGGLFAQIEVGKEAPILSGLKIIDNQMPSLVDKFVFIDFWATWCAPCRASLPHMDAMAKRFKDKIVFLAVSSEKEKEVNQFLKINKYSNLLFGLDIEKDLFSKFGVKSIPAYYLISPQNKVLASGYSSELSDSHLDSIISQYHPQKNGEDSKIRISADSIDKVAAIEIYDKPGTKKYLDQSGYTFRLRDSLKTVLPFLKGVKYANRMRLQNLPAKMVEVKIFSRNISYEALKIVAYNQMMAVYGITAKEASERTTVYNFLIKNPALLKNKDTFIEPGVAKKMELVNDSTMRFDNYSLNDLVSYLEGVYFPRLLYAQTTSTVEYDWDLRIVNPTSKGWISFDKLKEVLQKDFGIEIEESIKDEIFTVYSLGNMVGI